MSTHPTPHSRRKLSVLLPEVAILCWDLDPQTETSRGQGRELTLYACCFLTHDNLILTALYHKHYYLQNEFVENKIQRIAVSFLSFTRVRGRSECGPRSLWLQSASSLKDVKPVTSVCFPSGVFFILNGTAK